MCVGKTVREKTPSVQDDETAINQHRMEETALRTKSFIFVVLQHYSITMLILNKSQCDTLTHSRVWVFTFLSIYACVGTKNSGCYTDVAIFTWSWSSIWCLRKRDHEGGTTIAMNQKLPVPDIWQRDTCMRIILRGGEWYQNLQFSSYHLLPLLYKASAKSKTSEQSCCVFSWTQVVSIYVMSLHKLCSSFSAAEPHPHPHRLSF